MIKINDTYYIEVDNSPVTYTVKRRWMSQPKDGGEPKERFAVVGYYGTVEGAMNGLVDQVAADDLCGGTYSFQEAVDKIIATRDELRRMINARMDDGK